jgi:hypothetical protein
LYRVRVLLDFDNPIQTRARPSRRKDVLMMDIQKLQFIVADCLASGIVDPELVPKGVKVIDLHFYRFAIVVEKAERHREELLELLREWPDTSASGELQTLKQGPNYTQFGIVADDHLHGLMLMAVGAVLGFWEIITPATLSFEGPDADEMAELGIVMTTGFNPDGVPESTAPSGEPQPSKAT